MDIKLGSNWIEKLAKVIPRARKARAKQVNHLANELLFSPKDLAPTFIEPFCQPFNPSDRQHDEEEMVDAVPIFEYFQKFIRVNKPNKDGSSQLFLLGDAGMGKTSVLGMFALSKIFAFWPKSVDCFSLKLGPHTLDQLNEFEGNVASTILLLDSLDEDPLAREDFKQRVEDILQASKPFYRVVITCRTQFMDYEHRKSEPHKLDVDGFLCPVRYLTPFSTEQIDECLRRKFKINFFGWWNRGNVKKYKKGLVVAQKLKNLRMRPLILSYIDDLLSEDMTDIDQMSSVDLYDFVLSKWLERENTKRIENKKTKIAEKTLVEGLKIVSIHMDKKGLRVMEKDEFSDLCEEYDLLKEISELELKGRSLLTTQTNGSIRFAHYSIQEYFLAWACVFEDYNPKERSEMLMAFVWDYTCGSRRQQFIIEGGEVIDQSKPLFSRFPIPESPFIHESDSVFHFAFIRNGVIFDLEINCHFEPGLYINNDPKEFIDNVSYEDMVIANIHAYCIKNKIKNMMKFCLNCIVRYYMNLIVKSYVHDGCVIYEHRFHADFRESCLNGILFAMESLEPGRNWAEQFNEMIDLFCSKTGSVGR